MDEIYTFITAEVNNKFMKRLNDLSDHLLKKYPEHKKVIETVIKKHAVKPQTKICKTVQVKRKHRIVENEMRCKALTITGKMCKRSHVEGSKYCLCHTHTRPCGDIDNPVARSKGKIVKILPEKIDDTKYVKAVQTIISGTSYFIDENRLVFEEDTGIIAGILDSSTGSIRWF